MGSKVAVKPRGNPSTKQKQQEAAHRALRFPQGESFLEAE